ncbi:MAG TPA: ABC transporter permease [Candidatus Binataceae bacterium]|nr:ABC transporter permease [Candidatus Binataceae bacterium]
MGVLLAAGTLWWREITRYLRQRTRVVGSLLEPVIFWLVLGFGLRASFRPSGIPAAIDYAQYFYPGMIVLTLLFVAIFSTISTVEDRREGFLQGVLVAPVGRGTVVFGQALGGTTLALIEGGIFMLLAPLAGLHLRLAAVAIAVVVMAVVAFTLTSVGLMIAWRIGSTQGFHAIMNPVLIPIWLLSGAFFPASGAPTVLKWVMRLNPLTYGMAALREGLYFHQPGATGPVPPFGWSLVIALAFAAAAFMGAARVAKNSAAI